MFNKDFIAEFADAVAERVAEKLAERLDRQQSPRLEDEVLDTKEAASYLKLSTQQLEIWRCRGGGPAFSKLSRRVRYRKSELDAWLSQQQQKNTSGQHDQG